MPIKSQSVIENGFIRDRNGEKIKEDYSQETTVDLTIREILFKNKKDEVLSTEGIMLQPQDSIIIISEEIVNVPEGYIAYVFLKNRLSQRGLLALNTGIVDSNYYGPIATTLINFSNKEQPISISKSRGNDAFFRIVFHKLADSNYTIDSATKKQDRTNADSVYTEYKEKRIENLKSLPQTFMNPNSLKEELGKELKEQANNINFTRLGVMIALLGILFSLLPLAKDYYFYRTYNAEEIVNHAGAQDLVTKNLNDRVSNIEKAMDAAKTDKR